MLMPARLSWPGGRDLCRRLPGHVHYDDQTYDNVHKIFPFSIKIPLLRFGGRLHIDLKGEEVEKTFAIVEAGELLRLKIIIIIMIMIMVEAGEFLRLKVLE